MHQWKYSIWATDSFWWYLRWDFTGWALVKTWPCMQYGRYVYRCDREYSGDLTNMANGSFIKVIPEWSCSCFCKSPHFISNSSWDVAIPPSQIFALLYVMDSWTLDSSQQYGQRSTSISLEDLGITTGYEILTEDQLLTYISLVDCSTHIYWTSPFPILGVAGELFYFYAISNRNSCKQTVKSQIRRCVLSWICTVSAASDLGLHCLPQTPRSAASDLGLHCLPMSQKRDARLI